MFSRILTASVGLPVLIAIVWVGGFWFTGLLVIAAALAAWELCRMAGAWGQPPFLVPAVVLTAAFAASGHFFAGLDISAILGGVVAGASLFAALAMMLTARRRGRHVAIPVTIFIIVFIGGALFNAALVGGSSNGRDWIFFLLAVTFATDTGAYLVGKAVGSRKLAPTVSPGKTWEGSIGGLVAAILAGAVFGWMTGSHPADGPWLMVAPILGITGQLGDLYESKLKRLAGFDDSGTIFPGHGGILDRLDSMTFNLIALGLIAAPLW